MKLFWTPESLQDREDIFDFIERENPIAAIALDEMFSTKSRPLKEHPLLGKTGRVSGTRELVVHPSYVLIYDVAQESVRILRVLHTSRQWPSKGSENG